VRGRSGIRVRRRLREVHRGGDRQDDRAADLERASDESRRQTLLVVAHAGQRLDVQRWVGEAEAEAGQQTRRDDHPVIRAGSDVDECKARTDGRDGAHEEDRGGADYASTHRRSSTRSPDGYRLEIIDRSGK
jgi:hypothetical protein